eukprot:TRINITY_DN290_c0_g1_i8.p1 TRINITY_DN290_c0_g1~~TRINITY_DN290_c0_g1_i8.p1  ORF type:complete len:327 (-),score=114.64 TRINITY_DN290_c0_g1_i8:107-1087(-)
MADDGWEMVGSKKESGPRGGGNGGRGGQRGSGNGRQGGRGGSNNNNNGRGGNRSNNNNNNRGGRDNRDNRGQRDGQRRTNNRDNSNNNRDKKQQQQQQQQQQPARDGDKQTPAANEEASSKAEAAENTEAKPETKEITSELPADEEPRTVFTDPEDFNIKHPLQNTWNLFYDNPGRKITQEAWGEQLHSIRKFTTVEDFWCTFNNVQPPSQLISGSNYHLFKDGIKPAWEDPHNQKGGKWIVTIPRARKAEVDTFWLNAVLTCIGEGFTDSDAVCGVVVSLRKASDRTFSLSFSLSLALSLSLSLSLSLCFLGYFCFSLFVALDTN